jgi:hypothetical protein
MAGMADLRGGLVNPCLRTDRSVDARSAKTIVRDLVKPGMTEEEKVLAIFHWLRRVIYHSGPEEPMRHDFNKMINVFGYGSCYMQTHPLSHLFQQVGYPCRNWVHNTHHMIEVYYGGGWHCLDPHMTFYAYNRANPRAIAGVEELQADETLAGQAVNQKRAGPAFLICGDQPTWFAGKSGWTLDQPFTPHAGADEEFGAITLPRGMRYVRTWKTGKFYRPHAFDKEGKAGPYHTCGAGSDRKDPVNLPYWEPYHEGGLGRHYGTGYLEYAPDLRRGGWQDGALRFVNLISDADQNNPALRPQAADVESEVIFVVKCPYIVTGASLELVGRLGQAGDALKVSVSREWIGKSDRRKWQDVGEATEPGEVRKDLDLSPAVEGTLEGFWVRIVLKAKEPAKTGLDQLKVRADFQLNPYALPQLLPGQNRLLVEAARQDAPWNFRLAWSEGEGWKTPQQYQATIKGAGHEAVVEAAGPKFPRMESIEFSVDP